MSFLTAILYAAMALSSLAPAAQSDEWNKKSTLTADCKVELPGIVLEPGVYVIKLKEAQEKRSFVQVWNEDETQLLGSVVAVPDHRAQPEGYPTFTYHNTAGDGPRALQSWYYPGDQLGLEFVYPKDRAKELAQATDDRVMAFNSKDTVIVAVTPNGKEVVIDAPPQPAPTARRKPR